MVSDIPTLEGGGKKMGLRKVVLPPPATPNVFIIGGYRVENRESRGVKPEGFGVKQKALDLLNRSSKGEEDEPGPDT
jgi:hypothetical protein